MLLDLLIAVGVLVPIVVSATELITSRIPAITGIWSQVTSWVIAALLIIFSQYIEPAQFFATAPLWQQIAGGVIVGLISNGIFDIKLVQELLALIKFRSK